MKDVHVVGKKMTRNAGKMAKLIGCAFHFETEFITKFDCTNNTVMRISQLKIEKPNSSH